MSVFGVDSITWSGAGCLIIVTCYSGPSCVLPVNSGDWASSCLPDGV